MEPRNSRLKMMGAALALLLGGAGLVGCTQSMGRFAVVVEQPLPDGGITLSDPARLAGLPAAHPEESCIQTIVIIPDRYEYDLPAMVHDACPARQALRKVKLKRRWWIIPYVYGRDCLALEAVCEK